MRYIFISLLLVITAYLVGHEMKCKSIIIYNNASITCDGRYIQGDKQPGAIPTEGWNYYSN